jgi:hypothetical protein
MPFEPTICNCSLSEYRHVVKSQVDWERYINKARSDHLASDLLKTNELLKALEPPPQQIRKRSPSPEDNEYDSRLIPTAKRQLCVRKMDLATATTILLRDNEDLEVLNSKVLDSEVLDSEVLDTEVLDSEVLDSEVLNSKSSGSENTLQLMAGANEGSDVGDIEDDEANRLAVEHNEPAFLPPGYQLEEDSDSNDSDADYNDTCNLLDEETFDIMVGNMRRGVTGLLSPNANVGDKVRSGSTKKYRGRREFTREARDKMEAMD